MAGFSSGFTLLGNPLTWGVDDHVSSRLAGTAAPRASGAERSDEKPIISSTWPSACRLGRGVLDELDAVDAHRVGVVGDRFRGGWIA